MLIFQLALLLAFSGIAQQRTITYTGKVVDKGSGQPVAYATVIIADNETQQAITGTTTLEDGSFSLDANADNYHIEVSFIGFEKKYYSRLPYRAETSIWAPLKLPKMPNNYREWWLKAKYRKPSSN